MWEPEGEPLNISHMKCRKSCRVCCAIIKQRCPICGAAFCRNCWVVWWRHHVAHCNESEPEPLRGRTEPMSEPIPAHPEAVEEPGPEPEHRLVHFVEWMQSLTPAAGGKEEKTESESDEEGPEAKKRKIQAGAAAGNGPSSPAASAPPTSSSPIGPPSLLLRQLGPKILRHYIGTFLPQRCTLCDERRWVLAKCHINFEWWCLQCGICLQDSTHNGLPPSDSVHCGSSRGPSSHCEYSSAS